MQLQMDIAASILRRMWLPGVQHQIVGGVNYDLNEQLGMPENSSYTELVDLWALTIPKRDG